MQVIRQEFEINFVYMYALFIHMHAIKQQFDEVGMQMHELFCQLDVHYRLFNKGCG
jgi:hypothetical protein